MGRDPAISPIGLDFGENAVRAIQVRRAADQLAIVGSFEIPGDAQPAEVRRAFRKARFIGSDIVTNVGASETSFRTLRLAAVSDAELETAAHWQSARQLDLDSNCFQSRILHSAKVMEKEQERREVIVLAVPNEVIESRLRMLRGIGLNVRVIDATSCATHHALHFLYPAAFDSPVIVIVPYTSTLTLSIVNDGQIQFLRSLDITVAELSVMAASGSTSAQATNSSGLLENLAREVNKSIHHFAVTFNSRKPEDGLILRAHEGCQGLANSLSRLTNIPFEKVPSAIWSNVHGFDKCNTSGDPMCWAASLGLSLNEEGEFEGRGAA